MNIDRIKKTSFPNTKAEAKIHQYEMEGRALLATGITHEAIISGSNKGVWPEGSVWCFMTNEVYGPKPNRTRNAG